MFFGHLSFKLYSLVQSLHFSIHTPPVSKTANVKTWLTFFQSNIANLICASFAVQYILGGFGMISSQNPYRVRVKFQNKQREVSHNYLGHHGKTWTLGKVCFYSSGSWNKAQHKIIRMV